MTYEGILCAKQGTKQIMARPLLKGTAEITYEALKLACVSLSPACLGPLASLPTRAPTIAPDPHPLGFSSRPSDSSLYAPQLPRGLYSTRLLILTRLPGPPRPWPWQLGGWPCWVQRPPCSSQRGRARGWPCREEAVYSEELWAGR